MAFSLTDWLVIAAYLLFNLLIGFYYRSKAGNSTEDFFISGRDVSWWLAGTSMVATTFAADTPLLVCGLVATQGISGNWIWWSFCLSGMTTVFFFARYWRRAEILTDVELVEIRYGGKPAAFLRGFKAIYLGLLMNCFILGWVTRAMVDIISVVLGPMIAAGRVLTLTIGSHTLFHYTLGDPRHTALAICIFILVPFTGLYTFIGGLWGVLVTDLFQFALKMTMIVVLAWLAVAHLGGMHALKVQLSAVDAATRAAGLPTSNVLSFLPDFHTGVTTGNLWTLPLLTFFMYLGVQWWASWYPGAEPGGGGYIAQRMFSAKNEKHSLGATLWFNIAHYALRPWPWIVTGLVALAIYSPHGGLHPNAAFAANPQQGYVMVLRDFLPPALRGLMVAAFLAAYMSTDRHAAELGHIVPGERFLPALPRAGGAGASLCADQQDHHRNSGSGQRLRCEPVDFDQPGMGTGAESGRGHRSGVYPALVLVAGKRVERDHGDAGSGVRGSGAVAGALHGERRSSVCEKHADYCGHHDAGVDCGHICDASGA